MAPDRPRAKRRPAFYALAPGGWRDAVTLLHPPYTLWHVSYVALGAAAAPTVNHRATLWTILAFLLAVGVGAHALDELHGHPLGTGIPDRVLVVLCALSVGAAAVIGLVGVVVIGWWAAILVATGVWIVVAYNLELAGGRFHTDLWFAVGWGGFPAFVGYVVNARGIGWPCVAVTGGCIALSAAQRALSTPVRRLRRRTVSVRGVQVLTDGTSHPLDAQALGAPLDRALAAMAIGIALIAAAVLGARW